MGSNGPHQERSGPRPKFDDNASLLRYLYKDLTRLSQVAADDIVLHTAGRDFTPGAQPFRGIAAAQAHEERLVAATGDTLIMEVESITANRYFGTVLGNLRAGPDQATNRDKICVPFCGVWRFCDGSAVEHWENAIDAVKLKDWLEGHVTP